MSYDDEHKRDDEEGVSDDALEETLDEADEDEDDDFDFSDDEGEKEWE